VNCEQGESAGAVVSIQSLDALVNLVKEHNLMLASNVYYGSIGHLSLELDFLLRARRQGLVPGGRSCLLILREDPISRAFAGHFADLFPPFGVSERVWEWSREIIRALPELAFNIGVSHFSVERPVDDPGHHAGVWQDRLEYIVSQRAFRARGRRLVALRSATADWYPFRRVLSPSTELARFLDRFGDRPLAFVHVKQSVINATALPSDPATYLPTLAHIRDLGWQPVFVGRETMPHAFRTYGVADYAGSGFASPADDLALFSRGRVAITAASGIAHAFENLDLPLVYTNTWHIDLLCSGRRAVAVPTTMRERSTGRPLTVLEQIAVHHSMPDGHFYSFPHHSHVPEPASPEHVRAAFEEALALGDPGTEPPPPSLLQRRFSRLDPESACAAGLARVASAWAADFEPRFGDRV
jgi:putative glycosyltransferase (TIGR04372 family)